MQSSAFYSAKISQLEAVKKEINSLFIGLNNCSDLLSKVRNHTEDIVINQKKIGDGKLDILFSDLTMVNNNLTTIIKECDAKIKEYSRLYNVAKFLEMFEKSDK